MALKLKRSGKADAGRLADAVYVTLLEAILAGRLTPGTIVSELALSRQLRVSRTPVHDALRKLGKDGLVQQETRCRARIGAVTREDVQDIFEMRRLLETEAARRAATRIDRQTLAQLRSVADELARGRRDCSWMRRWADFDEQCHAAIAHASGSPRLASDIARYRLLHRALNQTATTVEVLRQAFEEHLKILKALDRRDPDAAARTMEEHIREWQAYFTNHVPAR